MDARRSFFTSLPLFSHAVYSCIRLTDPVSESIERRKSELKRLLEPSGSPKLHGLFSKKAKEDGVTCASASPEEDVDLDKSEVCKAVTLELQVLQVLPPCLQLFMRSSALGAACRAASLHQ
jgi:hypothetical protein